MTQGQKAKHKKKNIASGKNSNKQKALILQSAMH